VPIPCTAPLVPPACDPNIAPPAGSSSTPSSPPVRLPSLPGVSRSAAAPQSSQQQQTQLLDYLLKP